jgi:hypothetical protein
MNVERTTNYDLYELRLPNWQTHGSASQLKKQWE